MWIVYLADNSHEMSRYFFEKKKKKYFKVSSIAVLIGAIKVNVMFIFFYNNAFQKLMKKF